MPGEDMLFLGTRQNSRSSILAINVISNEVWCTEFRDVMQRQRCMSGYRRLTSASVQGKGLDQIFFTSS
jgi:hypothetical protein